MIGLQAVHADWAVTERCGMERGTLAVVIRGADHRSCRQPYLCAGTIPDAGVTVLQAKWPAVQIEKAMKQISALVLATALVCGAAFSEELNPADQKWAAAVEKMIEKGVSEVSTPDANRAKRAV